MNNKFSDAEIFKAFQTGDERALKIIFNELYHAMVGFSFRIIRDRKQAEDIFTDAFFKSSKTAASKNDYKHFESELYNLIKHRSIDYYNRVLKRMVSIDVARLPQESEDPVSVWMLHLDIIKTIRDEIKRLTPQQQKLAEYLFFTQLTPEQVAALLEINKKTVRNQRAIILKRFRNALKKSGLIKSILF